MATPNYYEKYLKYAENSSEILQPSLDISLKKKYLNYNHKYLQLKKLL
jgi:hypothetical protein